MKTQNQVQRITEMETIMDRVTEALHSGKSLASFQDDIRKLEAYYRTEWINDYEADEKGELPVNLKRGILSEDALYDLLCEADDKLKQN